MSGENYQILKNQTEFEKFLNWLPELEDYETFYLSLLARNKYCKDIVHINDDRQQLKRFTSDKKRMIAKIKQLECVLGSYVQYGKEKPDVAIPQEALALYIHPNPRNFRKACILSARKLVEIVTEDTFNNCNPFQEVQSAIQKSRSRKLFVDFDFDNISFMDFQAICEFPYHNALSIINTRGGLHVLVEPAKFVGDIYERKWYQHLEQIMLDTKGAIGDLMLPVPGCTQGNFVPKMLTINGEVQI